MGMLHRLMRDEHLDRKVHGILTIVWFLLAIPAVLLWRESVPFLVYVSVYANFVGHWSSYQAAKAETQLEEVVQGANGDPSTVDPTASLSGGDEQGS